MASPPSDRSHPSGAGEPAAAPDALIGLLGQGRQQFLALIDHIRPELHRYCTRMTGSVADGEDVVQETLARACYGRCKPRFLVFSSSRRRSAAA
jgi:Sigma-70 region 2